jgi:hypothetical protein
MKRLSFLLFVAFFCAATRGQWPYQSTNVVVVHDVRSRDLQARAMKFDPSTQQLLVLSSNNVISWVNPATLATVRELPLQFDAADFALSESGEILFVASGVNHAIYPIRLSDLQPMDPVTLGIDVPFSIESLPGSTNGFVTLALRGAEKFVRVFHNGADLYGGYGYDELTRTPTNAFLFYNGSYGARYRLEIHLGSDGELVRNTVNDSSLVRTGTALYEGRDLRYVTTSALVDTNYVYLFGGSSDVRVSVYDDIHGAFTMPMLVLTNIVGPPRCPVRWGVDGLAFIANRAVTTFGSTLIPRTPPADLTLSAGGFSGFSGHQTFPQIQIHNNGPAAATDIRVIVETPYPALVNFTVLVDATASIGSIQKFDFGYGFAWYVSRLEPGETATASAICDNPGFGVFSYRCSAIHAEADPTPYDTQVTETYELTLDPEETDAVKRLTSSIWGGGIGGSIYVPTIDREVGVTATNLASLNLHTGRTTSAAALDLNLPRIFINDLDPATFFLVHTEFRLYSADTMTPLWSMPRNSPLLDPTRANFYDVAFLLFPGPVTSAVVSYIPPVYPHTTNALVLYVGTNELRQTLEGGDQLFRTGSNTFLTYSRYGKLQSIRIDQTNLVLQGQWNDRFIGHEIDYKNGILYSADGRTYNADTMQPAGTFGPMTNPQSVRAYPQIDRAIFLMSRSLAIYELKTRQLIGTINSTNFVWNYDDVPRSIDFSPPDILYFSSTSYPTLVRTRMLRGLEASIRRTASQTAEISFFARAGKSYSLESSTIMDSTDWVSQVDISGNNASFTRQVPLDGGATFYRIVQH